MLVVKKTEAQVDKKRTRFRMHRSKGHSRSWMTRCKIARYYNLDLAPRCEHCGEGRQRFYRLHPFAVDPAFGRGSWLSKECHCQTQDRMKRRLQIQRRLVTPQAVHPLPPGLRACTFETFSVSPINRTPYNYCHQFAKNFHKIGDGKGLLLFGKSGTGKTHLACAVVNHLRQKCRTAFVYVPSFLDSLRSQTVAVEPYVAVDLLVLDDLGSERETQWSMERLLIIVEGRLSSNKPTVFTTNYDLMDLETRLGMALHSRVLGGNLHVLLQGPDHRLRKV